MDIQSIPIGDLHVSPLNVRPVPPDVSDLVASIGSLGLLQPITVRKNNEGYEIVAGQRRFLAAKEIGMDAMPCVVVEANDAEAVETSLAENFNRSDLDPIDACEAFRKLQEASPELSASAIAEKFAVPVLYVTQRMALAALPDDIKNYARKKFLDIELLEALTIAPPSAQKAWLKAAKKGEWMWNDASAIRRQAIGDKPKVGDNVFDISEYTGEFITDLFGDTAYFSDIKQFEELQMVEAERHAEKLRDEGWSWVKAITTQQAALSMSIHQFGKSKNKKIAGALVLVEKQFEDNKYVGRKIVVHTGLVDPETQKKIEREAKKKQNEAAKESGEVDTETDAGERPQSGILAACHATIAMAAQGAGIMQVRDHSDLLQIVCALIADGIIEFKLPKIDSNVPPIVGDLNWTFQGTDTMNYKMKPSERIMELRQMLAAAVGTKQIPGIAADFRGKWSPGEAYFQKLDKGRLAQFFQDVGLIVNADALRSGKMKRSDGVKIAAKVAEGDESVASSKTIKAARAWVPKELAAAIEDRKYKDRPEEK